MSSNQLGEPVEKPPLDGISKVVFSSSSDHLMVSSWDQTVRLYDASSRELKLTNSQDAPILDCCFYDEATAFSSSIDGAINKIDFASNSVCTLGYHDAGAQAVAYLPQSGLLISGGWDRTLRVWDVRSPQSLIGLIPLPGKLYSLSAGRERIVAATSGRHVLVFDARTIHFAHQQAAATAAATAGANGKAASERRTVALAASPEQTRVSSLKFPTRCVSAFPDGRGYALGSVEGRVSMEFFDPSPEAQACKYAFKCHRRAEDGRDVVYPVHSIAFHPVYGTFATGGGDGVINFWDGEHKKRLAQVSKYPTSVSSMAFNAGGNLMAVAASYCYETGDKEHPADALYIRTVQDSEVRPKQKR